MAPSSTIKQTPQLQKSLLLLDILVRIQKIDPEFPIQYAICLIDISMNEGCSLTEIAERNNMALSTVSRIVGALSDYRQLGTPYGFIEVKPLETERRKKAIHLTAEGRRVIKEITLPLEKLV